jgi:hypothetical protein
MEERITQLEQDLRELRAMYMKDNFEAKQIFRKDVDFVGSTKFGNKVGFFNETPVAQQASITTPSGGGSGDTDAIDISARTAIGQIKTVLQNLGLTL